MPHKNPEERRRYSVARYKTNRAEIRRKWNAWYKRTNKQRREVGRKYEEVNREQIKKRHKAYYEKNKKSLKAKSKRRYWNSKPEIQRKKRFYLLMHSYGITEDRFNEMWEECRGICFICELPMVQESHKFNSYHVDHKHGLQKDDEGFLRGILCAACNKMIGLAKERSSVFQRADLWCNGSIYGKTLDSKINQASGCPTPPVGYSGGQVDPIGEVVGSSEARGVTGQACAVSVDSEKAASLTSLARFSPKSHLIFPTQQAILACVSDSHQRITHETRRPQNFKSG